ncbi:hypothetical protein GSI_09492 [Ganoderma sinense ZZ0214-1]|uniref:SPX domain-containing protein n=1 Tax=Ganoderma sinense ZZ0214-1 TaxID=1077348 RepID=A0A2G8S3K6_9APHY|nr:hypothetical protein GSI_09492 [Ganoderma sinense ZZ0214-1]
MSTFYETTKKHIYQLEKQKAGLQESCHDLEADERTSLMTAGRSSTDMGNTDAFFLPLLDRGLRKLCLFYETEEQRLTDDLAALQMGIERQEESGPLCGASLLDEEADEDKDKDDEDFQLQSPTATLSRDRTQSPTRRRKGSRSISSAGAKALRFPGRYNAFLEVFPAGDDNKCTNSKPLWLRLA